MTLIHESNLDILEMYLRTKIKFPDQGFQKLEPEQDRQIARSDRTYYNAAYSRVIKISKSLILKLRQLKS